LHVAPLILLARVDSGIHHITDLPGHPARVSGPSPGDVRFRTGWKVPLGLGSRQGAMINVTGLSQLVLLAFGVDPDSIRNRPLLQGEAVRELSAGTLDAVFTTVYDSGDFVSLSMKSGARLIPLDGPAIDRLRREYAFIRPVSIPAGTYEGQADVLHTVGVDLVLICRSDLDEQLVYELTKAHLNALPRVWAHGATLPRLDLEKAPATPIPLHEGAARYYREWELFR
jgi:TRAP transporter TAXI family solute receptor